MEGIIINTKTPEGIKALNKHFIDKKQVKAKDKFLYKQTFEETTILKDEVIVGLKLMAKHRLFSAQSMKPIAQTMMKENGAKENLDYVIELVVEK